MLQRGAKPSGELAVGHQDHSDHQCSIVFARRRRADGGSRPCGGRIFVQCGAMFKRNSQYVDDRPHSAHRVKRHDRLKPTRRDQATRIVSGSVGRIERERAAAERRGFQPTIRPRRAGAAALRRARRDRRRAGSTARRLVRRPRSGPRSAARSCPANSGAPRATRRPSNARAKTRSSATSAAKRRRARAAPDQRQRQRALAGARGAAHQHAALADDERRRVQGRPARRRRAHGAIAGRLTTKRAPAPWRGRRLRRSAVARRSGAAVLGPDAPAVRLDDLARDRQAQARNSGRSPRSGRSV